MTIKIAITGGIATGKSECINFLKTKFNISILSSDKIVSEILNSNIYVQEKIQKLVPEAISLDKSINKAILSEILFKNREINLQIEDIIHPIVKEQRAAFFQECESQNQQLCFCEIPLLFEKHYEDEFDYSVLLVAHLDKRLVRFLQRSPNKTESDFYNILANQMSDEEKIKKANIIIYNNDTLDFFFTKINMLIKNILNSI